MENKLGITGITTNEIIAALEDALAEEISAWYAYEIAAPFLTGINHLEVAEEYKEHAKDEFYDHAYWLMERINQLGGKPLNILSPSDLSKVASHKYIVPTRSFNVIVSLDQNIKAEQDAIETYTKLEKLTRDKDIVTNTKVKEILADEQEHLQDLMEQKDACQNNKSTPVRKSSDKINYLTYFK